MIYVTGDTHGDFTRFRTGSFPEQRDMTKADYVIICGDFGIWDGSKRENYWLDWLENKPFTTLFVAGNHSNYDMLKTYPVERWQGGAVQKIRPTVIHLMRGQVFIIDGKRFFTMGGASSHDIADGILEQDDPDFRRKKKRLDARRAQYRIHHQTWWKEELPSSAEYKEAERNLTACGWNVDYIISHCCPSSIVDLLGVETYRHDRLTDFFETINNRCSFGHWFFGHYHGNRTISDKYTLIYEQILQIEPST